MQAQKWVNLINRLTNYGICNGGAEKVFSYSAEDAHRRSIELLSGGRQGEAEALIAWATQRYFDNEELLFAKGVLERSRWDKSAAELWFGLARRQGSHSYIGEASSLQLRLDRRKPKESDLLNLIRLSNEHPDDVYLLWLSAIQCREQKKAELGRTQCEKLLAKFRVGPVLLHQTYANILTEDFKEYDKALEHRYLAVALEAKHWSLRGLGDTLTKLERYDEACAVFSRAVQLEPSCEDCWSDWGWELYQAGRYDESLEKYRQAAALGDVIAINYIGICYEKGQGVTQNWSEATKWYRKAAGQGESFAQNNLGVCYANGTGVEQSWSEAVKWYRKSAKQGNADAQVNLGFCCEKGQGVGKNFDEAVKWYQLAAAQGETDALGNLGLCYHKGRGVEKDQLQAVSFYKQSLEKEPDNANTLNNYACLLIDCDDLAMRNYPEAIKLAERSVAKEERVYRLDTLADAYAHNGQYEEAVKTQKRLIVLRRQASPGKEIPARPLNNLAEYERKLAEQQKGGAQ